MVQLTSLVISSLGPSCAAILRQLFQKLVHGKTSVAAELWCVDDIHRDRSTACSMVGCSHHNMVSFGVYTETQDIVS